MKYIQLKTKEDFRQTMKKYNRSWGDWMWNHFKEQTCYIPEENYFISLERAKQLNFTEL